MRQDKLTERFKQGLGEAQSLALGRDHQIIEPHVPVFDEVRAAHPDDGDAVLDAMGSHVTPLSKFLPAVLARGSLSTFSCEGLPQAVSQLRTSRAFQK